MNIHNYQNNSDAKDIAVVFHKKSSKIQSELFEEINSSMDMALGKLELDAYKHLQMLEIPSFGQHPIKHCLVVVLDEEKLNGLQEYREAFGKVAKKVKNHDSIVFDLDSLEAFDLSVADVSHLLGEAIKMSLYEIQTYKTNKKNSIKDIYVTGTENVIQSFSKGTAYGEATNYARTLVNMPPNFLTSTVLAAEAVSLAEEYNFEATVLEKEALEEMGAGALLAVNQGSVEPPKMIVLKYQGKDTWENPIAFVGKGLTYDTGGYSIKPGTGMVGMKSDMGGAAAVLGAMKLIGEMKPKQNVLAVIPSTDNMISGEAMKPDDVFTSLSGKTIEVLNTDAEGRLALADGITYAKQLGARALIDVATLTGGVIVALGNDTTGVMTNDQEFYSEFEKITKVTGERVWQLPIFESDKKRVRNSKMADLNNSPGRDGHAVMGGAFVGEFAEDTPWLHLDIAGTATKSSDYDLGPSGATGVMVRTLAHYICSLREE